MNPFSFQRLRLIVYSESNNLEQRLLRLLSADYPSDQAPAFIKCLIEAIHAQLTDIAQIVDDHSLDPKGAEARLRSEHRKLMLRAPLLISIDNAQTRNVPWSLVPPIEALAQALLPGRSLLTSTTSDYNYQIQWSEVSQPTGLAQFNSLSLPATHRLDAFLHVLIGHELFHPLLPPYLNKIQPDVVQRLRTSCSDFIKANPQGSGPLFEAGRMDLMVEVVRMIWRRAMEELLCDIGCGALFGPAALMAMQSFFASFNPDVEPNEPDYYPPVRYRQRILIEEVLDKEPGKSALAQLSAALRERPDLAGHATALDEQLTAARRDVSATTDLDMINSEPLLRLAYHEVRNGMSEGASHIHGMATRISDLWSKTLPEVPEHIRNFRMHAPSGEIKAASDPLSRSPASFSAIAVAGWLHELYMAPAREKLPVTDVLRDHERSCRLILKSCDDAQIMKRYAQRHAAGTK